jgi:hypothetical protein
MLPPSVFIYIMVHFNLKEMNFSFIQLIQLPHFLWNYKYTSGTVQFLMQSPEGTVPLMHYSSTFWID